VKKEKKLESKIWILNLLPVSPPPLILPRRLSWNLTRKLLQRRKRGTRKSLVSQVLPEAQVQVFMNWKKCQDFVRLISELAGKTATRRKKENQGYPHNPFWLASYLSNLTSWI
jgi:hypothetical protein